MNTVLFVKALGAFFAIMNPFINLPMFLSLTDGQSVEMRRHTGMRVAMFSTIMCFVVLATGTSLLNFFGIRLSDFRVAGGLVLLTVAFGMLSGKGASSHEGSSSEQHEQAYVEDIAFYPMSFPMIVGPGTITTIIVLDAQTRTVMDHVMIVVALVIQLALLAIVLYFSSQIGKHMSLTLRTIMTRLMGMVLAAISIQLMANGLLKLFPGLGH
ncbi:MarC family protein [Actinomyces vulturis]|uniref:MarC family protein n=1 Tax=Actinomyces vulturis TaxID=1857645 RepID=UPI00082E4815|nr:MarC family protein [Actinomyces vulturis]